MAKDQFARHADIVGNRLVEITETDLPALFLYHESRIRDFQHERLIHLIVTVLVAVSSLMLLALAMITHELLFLPVVLMLMGLLFAYLVHYRYLENGVQGLYPLTEKLGKRMVHQTD